MGPSPTGGPMEDPVEDPVENPTIGDGSVGESVRGSMNRELDLQKRKEYRQEKNIKTCFSDKLKS